MTATAEQIARLRRMVNEPSGSSSYSDDDLATIIERSPLLDAAGEAPTLADGTVNTAWAATYDLNAAAAEMWEEKSSVLAQDYDFQADGGQYSRSQAYEQAMKQARYFRSKRAIRTFGLRPEPKPVSED